MTNFSIIIPHKNIPDLLQNCLNSIPQRDDVQVIVVDDDSDGKIVDYKHFPGLGRKNTEVYFTKKGKGAGYARNVGIRHATGKWLVFADADDTFNECFDEAMTKYCDCDNDVIFFKATTVSYTGEKSHRLDYINRIFDSYFENNNIDELLFRIQVPWGKFYNREFVLKNKIKFEEILCANDAVFATKVAINSINPLASELPIYCVFQRGGSLRSITSTKYLKIRFKATCRCYRVAKRTNKRHYVRDGIGSFWGKVYDRSRITGISLIPMIIRVAGCKYFKSLNVNVISDCRRDFLHKMKVGMPKLWHFFKMSKDNILKN